MPTSQEFCIEHRSPSELNPNSANAKVHSRRQIEQICRSISEFGFLVPVATDDRGTLIYGHARTLAAKKLGLERIPTVRISHLTEAQKLAFSIAENKLTENAEWDERLLAEQLKILAESDISFGQRSPASRQRRSIYSSKGSTAATRRRLIRPIKSLISNAMRFRGPVTCGSSIVIACCVAQRLRNTIMRRS